MPSMQDFYAGWGMPAFQPGDLDGLAGFMRASNGDFCYMMRVSPDSALQRMTYEPDWN